MSLAIASIGMSIPYAVVMGLCAAVGALVPLIRRWEQVSTAGIFWTLTGIALALIGVGICGRGGYLRERAAGLQDTLEAGRIRVFMIGLLFCVLSGVLSACANIGFDLARPVSDHAAELMMQRLGTENLGVRRPLCALVAWLPVWWGGYLAMSCVLGTKLIRNRTFRNFRCKGAGRELLLAVCMGALIYFAQSLYGVGAFFLGKLGTSVGWAVSIIFSLVVANSLALATGEWNGASGKSRNSLLVGLGVMLAAVVLLTCAGNL
jgi:hypothetical protein